MSTCRLLVPRDVQAMVGELDASWTRALAGVQGALGAANGTVGEIGVHHGGYFAVLAALAWPGEPLWACDLFDALQGQNLDRSGRGNLATFLRTVRAHTGREDVRLEVRPSYELWRDGVAPPRPFRLLSIDGSHLSLNAFTDLVWATRHVAAGALLILDDVGSARWLGPSRALRAYWHLHDRQYALLPLLMTPKKLWLAERAWHTIYWSAIKRIARETTLHPPARIASFLEFAACLNAHESRTNGTVDHAPLQLPPLVPPPRVWLVRMACGQRVRR